jgi:WD40 repeat protein
VFSAQYLPTTGRIATAAGDRQVRVFDVTRTGPIDTPEACIHVLRCHTSRYAVLKIQTLLPLPVLIVLWVAGLTIRVKRIITQDSPSYFLSVSEDHTVRSHDLRVPHTCVLGSQSTSCPPPLIKLPYRLSTMATSPLTPWLFAVAGEMPLAYLFDRRMLRKTEERWGVPPDTPNGHGESGIRCVRRFGRTTRGPGERKGDAHVTGSRMAKSNGHELILCQFSRSITIVHSRSLGFVISLSC